MNQKLDFKGLLKDKIFQILLFVVILNIVCFVLFWQLNIFVHTDLYNYGLIFSPNWANDFYYNNTMLWVFLQGATVLAVFSTYPHYLYSIKPSKFTRWIGFLLPSIAIVYQALSIMFIVQINSIVYNRLYDFGLFSSYNWSITYNPISTTSLMLMQVSLIVLIIPAIRTLKTIKKKRTRRSGNQK